MMSTRGAMSSPFSSSGNAMASSISSFTRTIEQPLRSDQDLVRLRTTVRERAIEIGMSLIEQTKTLTAASELAHNTVIYGGGGEVRIDVLTKGLQRGLRLTFTDHGPGIPDIELALKDGYSTGTGLGFGLGGAKRLVDEFGLVSEPGRGTTVTITKWTK